jgi:hypothetical protein
MSCDDYFQTLFVGGDRLDVNGHGRDRCSIPVIESRTAKAIAVMSTMTTFCCKFPRTR